MTFIVGNLQLIVLLGSKLVTSGWLSFPHNPGGDNGYNVTRRHVAAIGNIGWIAGSIQSSNLNFYIIYFYL